jgi:hypothetical protein
MGTRRSVRVCMRAQEHRVCMCVWGGGGGGVLGVGECGFFASLPHLWQIAAMPPQEPLSIPDFITSHAGQRLSHFLHLGHTIRGHMLLA